jgi:hypothetical protein
LLQHLVEYLLRLLRAAVALALLGIAAVQTADDGWLPCVENLAPDCAIVCLTACVALRRYIDLGYGRSPDGGGVATAAEVRPDF